MSSVLDHVIYYATAPIRLFGRSRRFRLFLGACAVLGVSFAAANGALNYFLPENDAKKAVAQLPAPPPLPRVTRASHVIVPVAIPLTVIRQSLDNAAPRELAGTNDNPVSSLLSKADIGITLSRGSMMVAGRPNELTVTTPFTGVLSITGQMATQAGNLTTTITNLIGNDALGKDVGAFTSKVLDQRAEVRGQIVAHAKPAITSRWRLEPNLAAQVTLGDSAVSLAGLKLNVANEARPWIEKAVNEQVAALENRLRNDPFIERAARAQWAKMCRAIPLGGGDTGLPKLWLEMRPVRAAAAQPQIDVRNLTLTIGVQAETRIVPAATTPTCPFPAEVELVPPMDNGKLNVGLPIDVPFTEVNKLLEAQMKGRTFPEDGNAPVEVEVKRMSVAPAGGRLLISLKVKAREKKSWFGFGGEANVLIWGKPVLDPKEQILRLTETELAVESEAALIGAAARAAMPYLQQALADNAVVDLKPFAADARKKVAAALADFEKTGASGVKLEASVNDLRLTGIAFDANTLRVIAEAGGAAKVTVGKLPGM